MPTMRTAAAVLVLTSLVLAQSKKAPLLGVAAVEEKGKVVVGHVMSKSPAAKAGLEAGDVLIRIGDQPIKRWGDVGKALSGAAPGSKVEITYEREGRSLDATAKLADLGRSKHAFLKRRKRGEVKYRAPAWHAFAWANVPEGEQPPTLANSKGKVVIFHAFQSW